jgi:hypothetical protein
MVFVVFKNLFNQVRIFFKFLRYMIIKNYIYIDVILSEKRFF